MSLRMILLFLTASLAAIALSQRPKVKDMNGKQLVDLADVGDSCTDSYTGYAIIDGSLERCDNFTSIMMGGREGEREAYEYFKCRRLRVHGEMRRGKCVCKKNYKGPSCNEYEGCPVDRPFLYSTECTSNICQHGGRLAVATTHMECICKGEWDGRLCDRLACWRLTNRGHDKRYRNAGDKCECGTHYEGENCSVLKSCEKNGKFENGVCICADGYGGETCGQKCPGGKTTYVHHLIWTHLLIMQCLLFR
ncbi:hypothetical protein PMAYCL1PPCAC_18833, partial [Pristionchus mayeri]